jgi:hypothetical protein
METCDRGVIEAREALHKAKDPRTLTRVELIQEVLRLRKYLGWMIVLNDDWADTDYDEELSQVMLSGGVYIAPLDTANSAAPAPHCLTSYGTPRTRKTPATQQLRSLPPLRRQDHAPARWRASPTVVGYSST